MEYELTANVQKEALRSLDQWISIPSVLDEKAVHTPFGDNIQHALEVAMETCQSLGMTTHIDEKGYYAYAEIGSGDELLAILCHLDVVPTGNETAWRFPPFELNLADGKLYGRGSQDDKGPSIAALYGLKSLLDHGYHLNKRVRFIFGADEETLWRCMERYNANEEQADYGFAPDSAFPLTFAEKGLLQLYLYGPGSEDLTLDVQHALNVVPDQAKYQGQYSETLKESLDQLKFDYKDDGDEVTVIGESIHAKDAPKGVNALVQLAQALNKSYQHPMLEFISKYFSKATGEDLFGQIEDEMSGGLTCNLAQLKIDANQSKLGIDMRIPVTANKEELVTRLEEVAQEYNLRYEEFDYLASLYVPEDSELVQTLLTVYRNLTGDNSKPLSSGGATFARTMPNCVAYGACLPDVPMTEHQINEAMPLKNFYDAMEIYAQAIRALAVD